MSKYYAMQNKPRHDVRHQPSGRPDDKRDLQREIEDEMINDQLESKAEAEPLENAMAGRGHTTDARSAREQQIKFDQELQKRKRKDRDKETRGDVD